VRAGDLHPDPVHGRRARALFLPLSLAVCFAMIASYRLSSTLVPILSV
jgi:Cu/Ag efflux pump CusA